MKPTICRFTVLALFLLASSFYSQAQSDSQNAHLTGQVTDVSGYGVAQVRVVVRPQGREASQPYETASTADGTYALPLPPGSYRVHFEHPAFVPRDLTLQLAPAVSRKLDVRLEIAQLSENVIVNANAQPLEVNQTPAPVDLIRREEIDQRQTVLLPDLLATQPGIAITRTGREGGLTTLFIDGGNSSFAKVLVDGTPVNLPGGDVDFSNLTLDNVDKVEIVHGAESALYGTDAMTGVIQIFTHRGTTRVPEADLFAEGGSFSSVRGGAQFSGALAGFDYSASGSYFHTDGQGVNDADLIRSYTGNVGYSFSDSNQIRFSVRSNSSFAGTPGQTLLLPADPSAFYDLQQLSANLSWSFQTSAHWSHRVSATEARYFSNSGFPPFGNALNQANRAGGWAQSTYSFQQGAFTAGYQYEVENATSSGFGFVHGHRNNQGGFLDGRWSPYSACAMRKGFGATRGLASATGKGLRSPRFLNPSTPIPAASAIPTYARSAAEPSMLASISTWPVIASASPRRTSQTASVT
jgi:outer membrane receptor protein involved in Fe transport